MERRRLTRSSSLFSPTPEAALQLPFFPSLTMSKRDAAEQLDKGEERGAKQPRCSEEAADVVTAAAASLGSAASSAARTMAADLISLKQLHTLALVNATRGSGSLTERTEATCALLKADGERAESMLDMSLRVDGNEVSQTDSRMLWHPIAAESASLIVAVSGCAAAAPGRLRVRAVSSPSTFLRDGTIPQ